MAVGIIVAAISGCASGTTTTINAVPDRLSPPEKAYVIPRDAERWDEVCVELSIVDDPFYRFRCLTVEELRQFLIQRQKAN